MTYHCSCQKGETVPSNKERGRGKEGEDEDVDQSGSDSGNRG